MQTVSTSYTNAYETAHSLRSLPRVIFEWNYNRIAQTVVASNGGDTKEDENFPISSIANALRGGSGLSKARVGEARTYRSAENVSEQFRTVGPRANYKYWTSTNQSNAARSISNVNPQVIYSPAILVNKIVIGVEQSWASPTTWTVSVTYDGNTWTSVASNTSHSIDSKGQIVIRRALESIRGVRMSITALSQPNAHANVIEISARREEDLSAVVMSCSTNRSTDESSTIFPVGQITSNTASVVLDNTDERFDKDNTASTFHGLLDTNVKVSIAYGTDVSNFGGSVMEYVPQGVYYVDSWNTSTENSIVEVPCTDYSKFFQQMQMHSVLFTDRTPGQIIGEILSSVGYTNYAIDISNFENQVRIPFVWFTDEDTVWDAMQSICSSVQGTLYTDENGTVRFVTRDKTYENASQAPDYQISAENVGGVLANLQGVEHDFVVEANKVIVNYKPLVANSRKTPVDRMVEINLPFHRTRRFNRREYDTTPIDSVLWKPENTVTLRASQLQRPITVANMDAATAKEIYINIAVAGTWPFRATVNIEGEIMSYNGKEYRWWKNGKVQETIVKTREEQNNIDDMQADLATRHRHQYTGRLVNVQRGLQGSKPAYHGPNLTDWQCWRKNSNNSVDRTQVRMTQSGSEMILWGYPGDSQGTYTTAHRGYFKDDYRVYGTRLRFANTAYRVGTAGMFWQMQSDNKQGYYVEINLTNHASKTMKGAIGEVRVYRMMSDGSRRALPDSRANAFGYSMPVVKNQWIDIDVTSSGEGTYNVYVNGLLRSSFRDPSGTLPKGTWGTFVRDHSVAAFEYFYVCNTADGTTPDIDVSTFQHKVTGGFVSGFADREVSRKSAKYVNWYMDEFGPWVHEMRKFQVEFDKVPALDAHVYLSNSWDAYLIEGNRTPFDATFWIANSGRDNAVLNGDDPTVYLGGGDIKQQLLLYGQLITEDEESSVDTEQEGIYKTGDATDNTVTYTDEYAIRKRGVVELTIDSKWIQSRSQAEALGSWIVNHWSEPVDNVTAEGFFSPAIQLGDLVSVNYPDRNMSSAQHRYHVVGISTSFEGGISISLTLRRVR